MSAPIGPGDYVECVRPDEPRLTTGGVYMVADLCPHCRAYGDPDPGVIIAGVVIPETPDTWWCCYDPDRFRPIYRRKEGAFDHLLKPVDEEVHA